MSVDVIIPWQPGCVYRALNLDWTIAKWESHGYTPILGTLPDNQPFIKADAVAAGLKDSDAEFIVVTDGDLWLDETIWGIEDIQNDGYPWVMPHNTINRMNPSATSRVLAGGAIGPPLAQRPYRGVLGGGVVIIRREVYDDVPLDPRFVGWGQEDESWGIALRTLHPDGRMGTGDLWHLWHPPGDRKNRRTGSDDSVRLRNRYSLARRKGVEVMRALIDEV